MLQNFEMHESILLLFTPVFNADIIICTNLPNAVPVETDKLLLIKCPSQPGASYHCEGPFLISSVEEKVS